MRASGLRTAWMPVILPPSTLRLIAVSSSPSMSSRSAGAPLSHTLEFVGGVQEDVRHVVTNRRTAPRLRGRLRRAGAGSRRLAAPLPARLELSRGHRGDVRDPGLLPAPDHPTRPGPLAPRRPPATAARLRDPVGQLLGPGGQHRRPAAVSRRRDRARGAGDLLGLDARPRLPRDARQRGRHAAVDGRVVDGPASRTSPSDAARSASPRCSATRWSRAPSPPSAWA